MTKVVIVGAGFAGLSAAKKLAPYSSIHLTVLDQKNHHLFQPLLYQVAMAGLSPAEIAVPIRSLIARHHKNVEVLLGKVTGVDLKEKTVQWDGGQDISYDFLILACGASHSYFGHDEWEEFAPGLKTIEQATEIRRRVLLAFEVAERETNPELQREELTFVVVGGGPTGVELAGALGEISRYTLARDFAHIDPKRTRIILIEGGPRILPSFEPHLSARAARDLERLGVTVWTSTLVTGISANGVTIGGGEFLKARTVLWAAGVKPSKLNLCLDTPLDRQGRVIVEKDLSIKNYPDVFVLGDQAHAVGTDGKPLPGLAPVAIQEGRWVARNILLRLQGKPTEPFNYLDKGQLATIGRRRAVVQIKDLIFGGWLAWIAWLLVHIYYLIGFRNRLIVLIQWCWSYFFYARGSRLIVSKEWRETKPHGTGTPPLASKSKDESAPDIAKSY